LGSGIKGRNNLQMGLQVLPKGGEPFAYGLRKIKGTSASRDQGKNCCLRRADEPIDLLGDLEEGQALSRNPRGKKREAGHIPRPAKGRKTTSQSESSFSKRKREQKVETHVSPPLESITGFQNPCGRRREDSGARSFENRKKKKATRTSPSDTEERKIVQVSATNPSPGKKRKENMRYAIVTRGSKRGGKRTLARIFQRDSCERKKDASRDYFS